MADMRALFTERFDAARTAWTQGDEPAAAESLRSAIIVARSDAGLRRELASALLNLGKLSRKFGREGEAAAAALLTEALAISEELFGSQNAALAPVLLELSRLYLQQSQHARAEDALERLLVIVRAKGDEHPDVAAALSDLAFVKHKLGDEASAEALYRDALRIREKVLEPNHTVTIGTLERLSETCAARGNFVEAVALLRRALPVREAALGTEHERVRFARSRIVELESKIAPEPPVLRPAPIPRERMKTPTVAAAVAAASLMASTIQTTAAPQVVAPALESVRPSGNVPGRESRGLYRDLVLSDFAPENVSSGNAAHTDAALVDRTSAVATTQSDSPEPARKKRTVLYASAGMAAVAVSLAALLMARPRAGSGKTPVPKELNAAQRTTAAGALVGKASATQTLAIRAAAAVIVAATHADSLRAKTATPAPPAAVSQPEQRAPGSAPKELRAPRVELHLDSANIPSMPAAPSGEAIMRSVMERQHATDTGRTETRNEVPRPTPAEADNAHTSPKIMGRAPSPEFPEALLRSGTREGQVVVRFMVNEFGRADVTTMVVEQSDHELFTAAVREVLPNFRFEPAHTLGLGSKPIAAWVSVPFRFTTKKR